METLLFYDRVIIPTVDYSIVVPLVHWIGGDLLKEALVSEAISFVRFQGGLAYGGNGIGLMTFEIRPPEDRPEPWWSRAARCSPEEAVILQLVNRLSGLTDEAVEALGRLVEICSVDTALPEFTEMIERETYRDILGSDVLTSRFYLHGVSRPAEMAEPEINAFLTHVAVKGNATRGVSLVMLYFHLPQG